MEKMKKQRKWTPLSVIGLLILILFAVICVAPFIYMVFMSLSMCWAETDSSGP